MMSTQTRMPQKASADDRTCKQLRRSLAGSGIAGLSKMLKSQLVKALNRANKRKLSGGGNSNSNAKVWEPASTSNSTAASRGYIPASNTVPQMSVGASRKQKSKKQGKSQVRSQATSQMTSSVKPKKKRIVFFGATVEPLSIINILEEMYPGNSQNVDRAGEMYKNLKNSGRILPKFHVTLIHKNDNKLPEYPAYWAELSDLNAQASSQTPADKMGYCKVHLTNLVCNGRVLAFAVTLSPSKWRSMNEIAHITIGTSDDSVKSFESNDMLQDWQQNRGGVVAIQVHEVLEGVVECTSYS